MVSKKLNMIIFSTIVFGFLLMLSSIILDIKYEKKALENKMNLLDNSIKNEYKKRLEESVNHTIIFIDTIYNDLIEKQVLKSNLTKENKKKLVKVLKSYLYNSIFEKSRYTWINEILDFSGGKNYAKRLIHPNLKETEGSYLSTLTKDIKGNLPYLEELEGIKKDKEVCFTYFFKQINKDDITEKLSYGKLYEKLNWVIITGIPINDLNEVISKEKEKLKSTYNKHLILILFLRALTLILFIALLLVLRKKLLSLLNENEQLNKQLEKKVKTMETSFDKFLELPSILFLISDLQGNIIQVNKGWKTILGYDKKDLIGLNFLDFVHSKDRNKTIEETKKLEKGGSTFNFENRYKHKNEEYRNLAWSANTNMEQKLIYAVAQDITEVKEKTNLIYQQSKMAAIGEMTANIAHQWRQPLSIISISASGILVKKEINDLDQEFLKEALTQIVESTKYLSETIEDFRNFFSPHKEKSYFLLEDLISKTLNLLEKRFENQGINIIKDIANIRIENYENELLQVLLNLLNNSRDQLIKENIQNKYIFINIYKKENKIYIEIIDNAKGIDENIIDRIFEPYFTTKDKSIGTGIGLYMSEEIVTKHLKGTLLVENYEYLYENTPYLGAKFTIILN